MKQKEPQKTAQRLAIYNYIKDNKSHPSVKEVYQHVSKQLSNISLTTVYNTMELFKKRGHIVELPVMVQTDSKRYDSTITPHDHMICTACGKVIDINVDVDRQLLISEDQKHDYDIQKIAVNVYGVCSECQTAAGKLFNS